uniref:Uncharacterized protein n=1 Tax=Tetranychus urticae TaxID=32264 RepID=T1L6G8_TETUR
MFVFLDSGVKAGDGDPGHGLGSEDNKNRNDSGFNDGDEATTKEGIVSIENEGSEDGLESEDNKNGNDSGFYDVEATMKEDSGVKYGDEAKTKEESVHIPDKDPQDVNQQKIVDKVDIFSRRQQYFVRGIHVPINVTELYEADKYESICLFGKLIQNHVYREDGKKYNYFRLKVFGSIKYLTLYFKYYEKVEQRYLQMKMKDLEKLKNKSLCIGGSLFEGKMYVEFIYMVPDFIVKGMESSASELYIYRLRLRVAVEVYNWSKQLYINHGERVRRSIIAVKKGFQSIQWFQDINHIFNHRNWFNWCDMLGNSLGINSENDHNKIKSNSNQSLKCTEYSQFFDMNFYLDNPANDLVGDIDWN